jgi:DNA-binding IclR family transcriptional regulator
VTAAASRTLTVLTTLAASSEPLAISQLAAATKISRATLGRLLTSLQADEAVAVDDAGRYRATARVLEPALTLLSHGTVREVSFPYMVELSTAVGYQVTLGLFECPHIIFMENVFVIAGRVSSRLWYSARPLLVSHTGRLMTAFAPQGVIDAIIENEPPDRRQAMRDELRELALEGYISFDRVIETNAPSLIAVPIFDRSETAIAALTVTRTTALDDAFVNSVLPKALDVARRISSELGSRRRGAVAGI